MDNNIIILKDIVKMSNSEINDVKADKEGETVNLDKKNVSNLNPKHIESGKEYKYGVNIKEEDFEETLERVIKKLFSDKIDAILERVIEDIVSKEIKMLKRNFSE